MSPSRQARSSPPSGRILKVAPRSSALASPDIGGLALVRVADGKVVEVHGEFDQSGLLEQIGASAAS